MYFNYTVLKYLLAAFILFVADNSLMFSQESKSGTNIPAYLQQSENRNANSIESDEAPPKNMNTLSGKDYYDAYQKYLKMPDESNFEHKKYKNSTLTTTFWQPIGPKRVTIRGNANVGIYGRIRSLFWYLNTANSNDTYWQPWVGACSGGIWYKEHFPANPIQERWLSAGDNLPNPSVGAILVKSDSYNGYDIIVGTGDWNRFNGAGLYESTNKGRTWMKIRLMSGTNEVIPGSITDIYSRWGLVYDTLFVSTDQGFFRSTNGGSAFSRLPIVPSIEWAGIYEMVEDETNLSILYAALPGLGIYKTTNSGTSWFPVNNGIDVTTNMGSTISIAISKISPNILFTAFTDTSNNFKAMYKTTNGGTNWSPVPAPSDYMSNGQGFHVNCIAINPTDPNKVYAGSVGLIRTNNGGTNWDNIDGGHSDFTHINFHPANPNLLYITSDGGIFIRDESNNSVQNLNEFFYPYAPIQEYGMDVANTEQNTIVSGTQDNGTLISTNAFPTTTNNWEQFSGCDGANYVSIDPTDANTFYFNSWCGATCPRLRSTTKSSAYSNIDNGLLEVYYTPITINKFNTNYVFTTSNKSLYYSTNKGDNWLKADRADSDYVFSEAPMGIAVNSHTGTLTCYVWFWIPRQPIPSDPNPGTRVKIFEGTPGNMTVRTVSFGSFDNISAIVTDQWNPDVAYAFTVPPAYVAYKTTNRGITWNSIVGWYSDSSLPHVPFHVIVSKPGDPNTMYAGTDLGVFKTTNNGQAWYKYQYGLPIVPVMDMKYIQNSPNDILKIGTFGKGYWYRELNGGDPLWQQRPTTINRGLHCPDTTLFCRFYHKVERIRGVPINPLGPCFMIANDFGTVERSFNGGVTWEMIQLPTKEDINDIFSMADGSVLVVGEQGGIFFSQDFGATWSASQTQNTLPLRTVTFLDSKTGFAAGSEGLLLKTDNGGITWTNMKINSTYEIHNINFINLNMGVATGLDYSTKPAGQFLIVTTDGGQSWVPSALPKGTQINKLYFKDSGSAFVLGDKGEIQVTSDLGQSWKSCNNNMHVALYDMQFKDSKTGFISGEKGTILETSDGGDNWYPEETTVTDNLYSIALDSTNALAIGDTVMLKRMPMNNQDTTSGSHIINVNFNITKVAEYDINYNLKCYPNPFSDITNIDFQLTNTDRLSLKVYDNMGREVANLAETEFEAGAYHIVFNSTALTQGIYYLRLSSLRHNETRVLTVIR